jgi:hypothetical protein
MKSKLGITLACCSALVLALALPFSAFAQFETKWMAVGSFQSWYASTGCEIEEGRIAQQQDGAQWPAIYRNQDMEAAKGLWMGVKNWTDASGKKITNKVVHVGPRVTGLGTGEVFPIKQGSAYLFMTSQFDPPSVTVDGSASLDKPVDNNAVDPTLKADRVITNVVNTAIGLTMTRKIIGFSQQYHSNYIIYDYTFTNTGNVNADATSEFPSQILDSLYVYFQYRYAVSKDAFDYFANSARWGINTMNDVRGDGLTPATTFFPGNQDNDVRAQYAWQGRHPAFTLFDNIGGSLWNRVATGFPIDTVGRLSAAQFIGTVTLHADKSPTDTTDDPQQPRTTNYVGSDDPLNSNNSQFNDGQMQKEYELMSSGHYNPRHADKVGTGIDPSLDYKGNSTSGGQSCAMGYGPYRLLPGQSVHIVMAEAADGLSRQACIDIGKAYKASNGNNTLIINGKTKNDWVYTGRDSLFKTFRRAIANYNSGYAAAKAPLPPASVRVISQGDKIHLEWDPYATGETTNGFRGYRVYRALARVDSTYYLAFECGPGTTNTTVVHAYDDRTAVRGFGYFYYVVAWGDPSANNGAALTPPGSLVSSRYYGQSYDAAFLQRPPVTGLADTIRIVPNPYNIAATKNLFPDQRDKIAFYNLPPICTIKIYTESGELVKTIQHSNGSGDEYWNSTTTYNQIVVSGVYIAVFESPEGKTTIQKMVIIR